MRLVLNDQILSEQPDETAIAQALARMTRGDDVLTLFRPPADFLQAGGSHARGFMLNAYEDAQGTSLSSTRPINTAGVTIVLTRYLGGTQDWRAGVSWRSGAERQSRARPRIGAGLIAFAIFATAFVAALLIAQFSNAPGRPTGGDWLRGFAGIVVISCYIGWIDFFFRVLRPRLARRLGARLGLRVVESTRLYDAGTWNALGGSIDKRLLVYALDIVVLIAGTLLPLAVPAVIIFLLAGR